MGDEERIREITALMRLMDEPDMAIFEQVSERISSFGDQALPFLENTWEASSSELVQERAVQLIDEIRFMQIYKDFQHWVQRGCIDLMEGCLILGRMDQPDLSEESVHQEMARIRKDIWLEVNENLTALEQIRVFNHVFYDIHGFSGNADTMHASANSYLHRVLQDRKGNPLSLSIIYMLIGQSLDIPVFGVNLPEHFVLAYVGESVDFQIEGSSDVLFYINAFSRGTVFSRQEVAEFVQRLGHHPHARYLEPCGNRDIIARMLNNLLTAYFNEGSTHRVGQIEGMRKLLND